MVTATAVERHDGGVLDAQQAGVQPHGQPGRGIDMQNGFLLPGMPFEAPAGREIIPTLHPRSSDLGKMLAEAGLDTVIITGTLTTSAASPPPAMP